VVMAQWYNIEVQEDSQLTLRGEKKYLEKVGVTYLKHDQW